MLVEMTYDEFFLENLRNEKLTSMQDVSVNVRSNPRVGFAGVETDSEAEEEPPNPVRV